MECCGANLQELSH